MLQLETPWLKSDGWVSMDLTISCCVSVVELGNGAGLIIPDTFSEDAGKLRKRWMLRTSSMRIGMSGGEPKRSISVKSAESADAARYRTVPPNRAEK